MINVNTIHILVIYTICYSSLIIPKYTFIFNKSCINQIIHFYIYNLLWFIDHPKNTLSYSINHALIKSFISQCFFFISNISQSQINSNMITNSIPLCNSIHFFFQFNSVLSINSVMPLNSVMPINSVMPLTNLTYIFYI